MTEMHFQPLDTLKTTKRLEHKGLNQPIAEEISTVFKEQEDSTFKIISQLATKKDLADLKLDFEDLRLSTSKDIQELKLVTSQDINNLKLSTSKDIEDLRLQTAKDFTHLRVSTSKDIKIAMLTTIISLGTIMTLVTKFVN